MFVFFFSFFSCLRWIHEFLMDTLCARHVIFRIKVDEYNLAPTYSPRFTVSKYLGDEINNIATTTLPSTCTSADVLHDETIEYLARINDDEWDMVHESLWGPRISPTQSKTSTSSVIIFTCRQTWYMYFFPYS
ncbi:hypothetical protein Hanom_Chr10g00952951 [Helianthus anomalus]